MIWFSVARIACLVLSGLLATVLVESVVSWKFVALMAFGFIWGLYHVLGELRERMVKR